MGYKFEDIVWSKMTYDAAYAVDEWIFSDQVSMHNLHIYEGYGISHDMRGDDARRKRYPNKKEINYFLIGKIDDKEAIGLNVITKNGVMIIARMIVNPDFRGNSFGKETIKKIISNPKYFSIKEPISKAIGMVVADNKHMKNLFEELGFSKQAQNTSIFYKYTLKIKRKDDEACM